MNLPLLKDHTELVVGRYYYCIDINNPESHSIQQCFEEWNSKWKYLGHRMWATTTNRAAFSRWFIYGPLPKFALALDCVSVTPVAEPVVS